MATDDTTPGPDDGAAQSITALPQDAPGRRRWWRPSRRTVLLTLLGPPLVGLVGLGALYASTDVPRPETLDVPQVSVIAYADGSELGRIGAQNRIEVPITKVSDAAQKAVLAAENRDFYSEPGISLKGIVRAALANARGGARQGASTITQQYAKNAYLTRERTYTRKLREAVIAIKLERAYSKDQVLEFYLNTVYFGRGAYGIETAAQTYFGVPAAKLTAPQGAVLASLLRSPSLYDPARDPGKAKARWDYVIDGMAKKGWLQGSVAEQAYPKVRPRETADTLAGPEGYLVQQVQDELEAQGITEGQVRSGGLRITSTIDRRAQAAAVKAVRDVTGTQTPKGLHKALVAVEPLTGRIVAEYAGANYVTRPFNDVTQGIAQAGSSFKPYVLAAALDTGLSLKTVLDGASPQRFGDYEVRNFGPGAGEQFGKIDLVQATVHSVNTVYVPLGERAGLQHVSEVAARLGVTADMSKDAAQPSFPLGTTAVRPLDQAVAYATLAGRGVRAEAHIVQSVTDPDGRELYTARAVGSEVLPTGVVDDTTFALQQVVAEGTGTAAQLPGRPAAGKTGTTSGNTAAWFVGYTPQLAAAVALFSDDQTQPLRDIAGVGEVTGGTLPARTWQRFMAAALEGQPVKQFAPPVYGGRAPEPSPSAVPSPTASPSPSASPIPTASPLPSPSPPPSAAPSPLPAPSVAPSPLPAPSARTPQPVPSPPAVRASPASYTRLQDLPAARRSG